MKMSASIVPAILLMLAPLGAASIKTATHDYKDGEQALQAFVAYDAEVQGKRPAVAIVHQWMGIGEHEKGIAQRLAEEGYFVFCIDVYGVGNAPADSTAAATIAGSFRDGDRKLFRQRLQLGVNEMSRMFPEWVDETRTAAFGYCFGGTGVLELARTNNSTLDGVVSFHGSLAKGTAATAEKIDTKVLVLHGADDPWVPLDHVNALQEELRVAKADWEVVAYGGAVHSFTDRGANTDSAKYDAKADARSWERSMDFLNELFER
jgi:dienelactone hydrolase